MGAFQPIQPTTTTTATSIMMAHMVVLDDQNLLSHHRSNVVATTTATGSHDAATIDSAHPSRATTVRAGNLSPEIRQRRQENKLVDGVVERVLASFGSNLKPSVARLVNFYVVHVHSTKASLEKLLQILEALFLIWEPDDRSSSSQVVTPERRRALWTSLLRELPWFRINNNNDNNNGGGNDNHSTTLVDTAAREEASQSAGCHGTGGSE